MSKSTSLLDKTYVATPCTADWERMEGDAKKRFCGQCSLYFYNVSALSRGEAEALIARAEGRLCMRLYRRADGTVITRDCPVGLRAVRRRVARAAGATFAAVLSFLSVPLAALAHVSQGQAVTSQTKFKVKRSPSKSADSLLKLEGTVYDIFDAVVSGASVTLVREGEEVKRERDTSDEGVFSFGSLRPGSYTLVISSPGFSTFTKNLLIEPGEDVSVGVTLEVLPGTSGVVVTQGDVVPAAKPSNN